MAGGREWTLEDKSDEYETYNVVDGDTTRHFRAKKVVFEISRPVPVEQVDTSEGALGKTSGMLTFSMANVTKTRSLAAGKRFLCTADNSKKIQTAGRHYLQTQVWEMIEEAEEYDPRTGAVI